MNSNDSDPTRTMNRVDGSSSAEPSTDTMPAIAKSSDAKSSSRTKKSGRTEHSGPIGEERSSLGAKAKGMLGGLAAGAASFSATGSSASGKDSAAAAASGAGAVRKPGTGRRVRLTLARLDPWSVMKLSFLIAIGIGIATVVATMVLWQLVDAIGLWDKINEIGKTLSDGGKPLKFLEYFQFSKFVSYATLIAIVNVVIITALGTLLAFLYNIVAALLGGLKFTFTDD